ncbi:MAG: prepilin-type N-terminal cleavage/methylation domain-containing protein [Vulcanimicrobiota bacterium]
MKRAFTLAEVMVALVLISLGLFSLMSISIYSLRAGQFNREHHTMVRLAGNQMAWLRSQLRLDFRADLATASPQPFPDDPDYRYAVALSDESPDRRRIDLVVSYQGGKELQDVKVWTYVYRAP